jgi:hypothetical protein
MEEVGIFFLKKMSEMYHMSLTTLSSNKMQIYFDINCKKYVRPQLFNFLVYGSAEPNFWGIRKKSNANFLFFFNPTDASFFHRLRNERQLCIRMSTTKYHEYEAVSTDKTYFPHF